MSDHSTAFSSMTRRQRREWLHTFVFITLGAALYCIGTVFFIKPAKLPNTGVTGICLFLNYLWNVPLGISNAVINGALFLFAFKFLPRRFFWWTLYTVLLMSVLMDFFDALPKPVLNDRMLLVVVAGVLHGVAMALTFSAGGSTGGTDIISMAVRRRYGIELGSITMALNFGIILLFLFIIPLENAIYGFLLAYLTSLVLNGDLRAFTERKEAMVIANNPELVRNYIVYTLHRGVTMFTAQGGWKDQKRTVLISLLSPRQAIQLKLFLKQNDPGAFMRLAVVREVLGRGFQNWED
ncbi:MAG: YitT family protein [Pyramidobacter sp.]|jgi:uncharacterized membrane-anchored protein YitT (DUF2179 family)